VANGSEGTVLSLTPISVCFQGHVFTQGDDNSTSVREMFDKLEGGTISTVHKFQGSEAHTIVAVFLGDYRDHNTIQLLYTAASRARKKLIVIMEERNLELFSTRPGHVFRNIAFNNALAKKIV
jgi:ATP-dependent exoDNAse (exonuclease V) alpha subunit